MKHDLKFKTFKIDQFKEEDGALVIEGWGAKYNNIDSYGDIMKPGSCTKTIQERGDRIAFCYMHDIYNPIGKIQVIEDKPEGLWVSVKLSAAEEDIQTKIKEGILKEMSIGYREINSTEAVVDGKTINYLNEVMLYEVSLVTIAANPLAVITGMKSEEKGVFIDEEFERLISIERNSQKKFELMKLKTQVLALIKSEPEKPLDEPEPLKSIVISENLFTQNLKLEL